jgi:hypothetical protein
MKMRDEQYLAFIRERLCAFCGAGDVEPHHAIKNLVGISAAGLAQKGSDYLSIPVCHCCHERIHRGALSPERAVLLEYAVIYLICFLNKVRRQTRT